MDSNDSWREKREDEERQRLFYKAIRTGDHETALPLALGVDYLDYLKRRETQRGQPLRAGSSRPGGLSAEQKSLLELLEATQLDIHGRVRFIQRVNAINPASPGGVQELEQLRKEIESYL